MCGCLAAQRGRFSCQVAAVPQGTRSLNDKAIPYIGRESNENPDLEKWYDGVSLSVTRFRLWYGLLAWANVSVMPVPTSHLPSRISRRPIRSSYPRAQIHKGSHPATRRVCVILAIAAQRFSLGYAGLLASLASRAMLSLSPPMASMNGTTNNDDTDPSSHHSR